MTPDPMRLSTPDLHHIITIANQLADTQERHHGTSQYVRDLRHIARDAQAALDGCPASLDSVNDWLQRDHQLAMACAAQRVRRAA